VPAGLNSGDAVKLTVVKVEFENSKHYACFSCTEKHIVALSTNSLSPNGVVWSISPVISGGASITSVSSDRLSVEIDPGGIRTNYAIIAENSLLNECQDCLELIVGAYEWKGVGTAYGQENYGIIDYSEHLSPQDPNTVVYRVEPGQEMIFRITIADRDLRRQMCNVCSNSWSARLDPNDEYKINFNTSEFGSFDALSDDVLALSRDGRESDNVYFRVLTNFVWATGSTQIVTAVLYDCNTNSVTYPDTGSKLDDPVTVTWRFIKPNYEPHSLSLYNGGTSWVNVQATYIYNVLPDPNNLPPGSQPYFESHIMGESFTYVDPEFTMSDVASSWLYDPNYPERSLFYTATDVARNLWPGPGGSGDSGNGTFKVDADDRITDKNSAEVFTEPFTASALTNGVGFRCEQSFTFGANVVGTCDLMFKRFATNDVTTVLKSAPY